jgi:hypothetical protein
MSPALAEYVFICVDSFEVVREAVV